MSYLDDGDVVLWCGDALDVLRGLPSGSVDCIVTSPPYYGLRDYGTARWEGGDAACDHKGPPQQSPSSTLAGNGHGAGKPLSPSLQAQAVPFRAVCGRCGARRVDSQIGLEPTPEEWVASLVAVFGEARRVLADHGTAWVNVGDSYNAHPGGAGDRGGRALNALQGTEGQPAYQRGYGLSRTKTLKPKDLIGAPWRLAFALQADGWWLRADIVWSKPNPMPESVTDRPTKSHEFVFLLAKRERYWFDADAVREPLQASTIERGYTAAKAADGPGPKTTRNRDVNWDGGGWTIPAGRNIRTVWEIATQPYPEAHFATFPEELVRRCIAAGCPEGGTVLDPFVGSGTTALVARRMGRRCVGIDLSPEYLALAARRLQQLSLLA